MKIKLLSIVSQELNDLINEEIANYLTRTTNKCVECVEIVDDEIEIEIEIESEN